MAKNEKFQAFVATVADVVLKTKPADVEALLEKPYDDKQTVAAALQELILVIGENQKVRRFETIAGGEDILNVAYVHMGGKIGVLVSLKVDPAVKEKAEVAELAHDLAMQICAMNPAYLSRDVVPAEVLDKEREIARAKALEEGKPEKVIDRIVEGSLVKYYQEVCLLDQAYVKESKMSVAQHIAGVAKAVGGSVEVAKFVRFEKGEGLAKREENFAEEIAKLTK